MGGETGGVMNHKFYNIFKTIIIKGSYGKNILSWHNTIFGRNNEDGSNISPLHNKEKCQFTFKAPILKKLAAA